MKISYITSYDATDIRKWSGLGYYISKALAQQGNEIDYIGNLPVKSEYFFKSKKAIYRALGKQYLWDREPAVIRNYATQAQKKISTNTDIIFSPGTLPLAYLDSKKPKVCYTDSVFAGMIDYYPYFSNLCEETIRNGHAIEQLALDNADLAIFSSEWAAQSAITHYNTPPEKIKVIPFGANIESNRTEEDIRNVLARKSGGKCILLFLAVEWKRKGGDKVLEIAEYMNKQGLQTEVRLVGLKKIPVDNLPGYVNNYGYVSKATEEGRHLLNKCFEESHFLILPSEADCTPVAFSEANSYGLPVISTKTGGIPTVVKDNVNGTTFDLKADAKQYGDYIISMFSRPDDYRNLAMEAFHDYNNRLNWTVTGKQITELMQQL